MKNLIKTFLELLESRIIRFLIAGSLSVLSGYAMLFFLTEYLKIWYLFSSVIAFIINIGTNFLIHKHWTFVDKEKIIKEKKETKFIYLAMRVVLLIANTILMYVLVDVLFFHYMYSQVFLSLVLAIPSYFFSKIIFTK